MHARRARRGIGTVLTLAVTLPASAAAQLDYRNLDDDRPTRVEDAYPVERYAFELLLPWRYSRHREAVNTHAFVPELAYGLLRNTQVGVKLPVAGTGTAGDYTWGLSGLRLFGLYNFNTESGGLPALSLRGDAVLPVGSLAGSETSLTFKGIATRSFGRSRLHLNGALSVGGDGESAAVEAADKWWFGAAVDRTLFRPSLLLIAEAYTRRPFHSEPSEFAGSLGVRYQWTTGAVLDFGVSRRLGREGPDLELTAGFSRAFAIAGLMPGRR